MSTAGVGAEPNKKVRHRRAIPLILKADQETNSLLRNGSTKSEILTPEDFFEKFTDENGEKEKYPIDESTHEHTQLDELPRGII